MTEYVKSLDHDLTVFTEVKFRANHSSDSGSIGVVSAIIRDDASLLVKSVTIVFPDLSEITLDRDSALSQLEY